MRVRSPVRFIATIAIAIASTTLSACGSSQVEPPRAVAPANAEVSTALVIDQFLRAANSNDLDTMARLFGTRDGSILRRDPKEHVDRQMFALASLLRHDSYSIKGQEVVPGRRDEATRVIVAMKFGDRNIDVPYTLVWANAGTWMVETIDLMAITRR